MTNEQIAAEIAATENKLATLRKKLESPEEYEFYIVELDKEGRKLRTTAFAPDQTPVFGKIVKGKASLPSLSYIGRDTYEKDNEWVMGVRKKV